MSKEFRYIKGTPLLGHIVSYGKNPLQFHRNMRAQYGEYYQFKLLNRHRFCAFNPQAIHYILNQNPTNFARSEAHHVLKSVIGEGLATSEGDTWKEQRHRAKPFFRAKAMAQLSEHIVDISAKKITEWKQQGLTRINLENEILDLTIRIACKAFFGAEDPQIADSVAKHTLTLQKIVHRRMFLGYVPEWIPTPTNLLKKTTISAFDRVIEQIKEVGLNNQTEHQNLLNILLASEGLTNHQVRDELLTYLAAGYETTASALTLGLNRLAHHHDIRQIINDEIHSQFRSDIPDLEALSKLEYTPLFIKEVLRLYPTFWSTSRRCINGDELNGYRLPVDAQILLPLYEIHRHPDYWHNPELLDPLRFEKGNKIVPGSYAPFGGGPRACIGAQFAHLEMMHFMIQLLQNYEISLSGDWIPEGVRGTLAPSNTIMLDLKPKRTCSRSYAA